MSELDELMARARETARENFGDSITFYHPGMFRYGDEWGKYPAISITGDGCEMGCDHCKGKLLEPMMEAATPERLVEQCHRVADRGDIGVLLSGGSARNGSLPWEDFLEAILTVKSSTDLLVSVHSGVLGPEMAAGLKRAGVDQALIDIIGDDETIHDVYGADYGARELEDTLAALEGAGVPTVPHIIVGLGHGKIKGEYRAIDIISRHRPGAVVVVSFMPIRGTPMGDDPPPAAEEVARIMASARLAMPDVPMSLGCARERGNSRLDTMAVECGMNRVAIPSDEAIAKAEEFGLEISWNSTCCSVPHAGEEE